MTFSLAIDALFERTRKILLALSRGFTHANALKSAA